MRCITVIFPVLVLLLASCADRHGVQPLRTAPTVVAPKPSKPVDLKPVSEGTKRVAEHNRQLRSELDRTKANSYELRRKLAAARAAVEITADDWTAINQEVEALEVSREMLNDIVVGQAEAIVELEAGLASANTLVAASEQEKESLREMVKEANVRIVALSNEARDIAAERDKAKTDKAVEEDRKKAWRKSFWWALGAAVLGWGILLAIIYFSFAARSNPAGWAGRIGLKMMTSD
jgi:septal ring factor EnvC (AmiA/AmiB activator)